MKWLSILATICISVSVFNTSLAQNNYQPGIAIIAAEHLQISYGKTTHLIFPYAIVTVDRGSKDVLAQKAKSVDNILQLKAGTRNFEETNLTVVTADGKVYSFIVDYSEVPATLTIQYLKTGCNAPVAFANEHPLNEMQIESDAQWVSTNKRMLYGIKRKKYGIHLQLRGIYIDNDVMYYQLLLQNNTQISYDIEQLRFFVRDLKQSKRTANQEKEVKPVLTYNDSSNVPGNSQNTFVIALPKLTIPDKKSMVIQLEEKNGGRHLQLRFKNGTIIKAKPVPVNNK